MSVQITTSMVNGYSADVERLLRQEGSKLRGAVRIHSMKGEKDFIEQIGSKEAQERAGRHSKVNYTDTPHSRRMVVARTLYDSDLLDKEDEDRVFASFAGEYAKSQADALGVKMDRIIIAAATGTAYTGKDGSTSQAFDTNMVVDVQVCETGVTPADFGLNVAKLRKAKRLLDEQFVPAGDRFLVPNARQMESLLGTTRATSSDYNSVKALVQGEIDTFMGFKFLPSQYIETDGNGDDKVLFFHRRGIVLGIHHDVTARMDRLPEYHYSMQIYTSMDVGATRMQEGMVGYIECDPSAGAGG